jgi:hypothetical protein
MKYFVGSFLTIIISYIIIRLMAKKQQPIEKPTITYNQTHIFNLIKDFLPDVETLKKTLITQATQYMDKAHTRVVIVENKAYWIANNMFYVADISENGIDKERASIVDTMGMNKIQLDKMLFIMDKLREGRSDDSWSSGD